MIVSKDPDTEKLGINRFEDITGYTYVGFNWGWARDDTVPFYNYYIVSLKEVNEDGNTFTETIVTDTEIRATKYNSYAEFMKEHLIMLNKKLNVGTKR